MAHHRLHLLVVDDDNRLRELLGKYLSNEGFKVTVTANAASAREKLANNLFDLIVLDVMMPGESGVEFIQTLRSDIFHPSRNIPILLLTAMGESQERIVGLETGADDYLIKPFEARELLLRIQNILKRVTPRLSTSNRISLGRFNFDTERATLYQGDQSIGLTTAETNLLQLLALNLGCPLSRDELARRCGVELSPRTIDVQVTRLRRKIEPDMRQPQYIKTVRHKGYVLWPD
jgi:two-component system phosphate regulon response regulator OmpR